MSITVGGSEIKCAYIGNTALKEIYVGNCKVRPVIKEAVIDFLLVGGGGAGGSSYSCSIGGGGGGGLALYCSNYLMTGCCQVVIGAGGWAWTYYNYAGCPSCFGSIVAYGGGAGGIWGINSGGGGRGGNGGGGAGGANISYPCYLGGAACNSLGKPGSRGSCSGSWFGGGGGGQSTSSSVNVAKCDGGTGYYSDISGTGQYYGSGGGGGGDNGYCGLGGSGAGNGGVTETSGANATYYGGGGGGSGYRVCNRSSCSCKGGSGYQGIFIARYPTACGYNITGGTKYTCGNYTIHCFTSNGTLTVN